jgi:hypothetical protein
MDISQHYLDVTSDKWEEVKLIAKQLAWDYIFRGHADTAWRLETKLLRVASQFGLRPENIRDREQLIIKRFKSRAHHYIQSPPDNNANIEWLSLIQDYGGPTRLLDFTQSFYIASFFALESSTKTACIWSIHESVLFNRVFSDLRNIHDANLVYGKDYPPNPMKSITLQKIL